MYELCILGLLLVAWACAPHKRKRRARVRAPVRVIREPCRMAEPRSRTSAMVINLAQLDAMGDQVNAACELGIALDRAARQQHDPVKRARLAQQSANAYARAASLQAKIDRMARQ